MRLGRTGHRPVILSLKAEAASGPESFRGTRVRLSGNFGCLVTAAVRRSVTDKQVQKIGSTQNPAVQNFAESPLRLRSGQALAQRTRKDGAPTLFRNAYLANRLCLVCLSSPI